MITIICFFACCILFSSVVIAIGQLTMTRIFLAGPMTGIAGNNYDAFFKEEARLKKIGFRVMNPARNAPTGLEWEDYMRRSIKMLLKSDMVARLPGWEKSKGARLELDIATHLGMDIFNSNLLK